MSTTPTSRHTRRNIKIRIASLHSPFDGKLLFSENSDQTEKLDRQLRSERPQTPRPLLALAPEIGQYSQTQHHEAYLPVSRREEDYGKSPEEDSHLSQSFFPTQIDHLSLDVLPTPRQQRHENNERDCRDEEYFCEITRVVAEGQKQANFVPDQPSS